MLSSREVLIYASGEVLIQVYICYHLERYSSRHLERYSSRYKYMLSSREVLFQASGEVTHPGNKVWFRRNYEDPRVCVEEDEVAPGHWSKSFSVITPSIR